MLAGCTQPSATAASSTSRINTPSAWSKPQHDAVHRKGRTPVILAKVTALGIPAVAYEPGPVAQGALASYGADYRELGRAAARYVGRIFAGAEPRDVPVERIDRPAFALNLRTAKALGLSVPHLLLVGADEVIE